MKRAVTGLTVGIAVLAAAGCSGKTDSDVAPSSEWPMSQPVTSSSSGLGLPHSGAPAVADPLPESVLSGDPCDALTRQQVESALGSGTSEGQRRDLEQVGPRCDWSNKESMGGMSLGFVTAIREGLSVEYANVKPKKAVFRETRPVSSFPAVAYKDSESDRICTVVVGLADEYSISVTVTLSAEKEAEGVDSCVPAEQVAEMVVGNLKAKAGE
ncbi:DUF3558 domain-containing protein [Saccharomonospora azurea]